MGGGPRRPEGLTTADPDPRPGAAATPGAGRAGLALAGRDGRWRAVEPELCAILGRDEEELGHCLVDAVLHPEDAPAERARHAQLLGGALREYRAELRLAAGDGAVVWAAVEGRVAVGAAGSPEALVLLMADASARRRLEAAGTGWASDADEVDDAAALVAIRDPDGRYVRVGRSFEERFRIRGDVLRGRPDSYLFPLAVATALQAQDGLARGAPGIVEGRDVIPLADGDHPFAAFRFALLGPSGVPCGVCTVWGEPEAGDSASALAERLYERERAARAEAAGTLSDLAAAEAAAHDAAAARLPAFVAAAGEGLQLTSRPVIATPPAVAASPPAPESTAPPSWPRPVTPPSDSEVASERERDALAAELADVTADAAARREEAEAVAAHRDALAREVDAVRAEAEAVAAERDALAREMRAVRAEAEAVAAERDALARSREEAPVAAAEPLAATVAPPAVGVGRFSQDVAQARDQAPPSPWRSFGKRLLGHRRARHL
jgi:PAS domain S-box-containing protein